jgi:N-methylhydantoinase A
VTLKVTAICATPKPRLPKLAAGSGKPTPRTKRHVVYTKGATEAWVYDRETLRAGDRIQGPALVEEPASVTILPPGTILEVDGIGNLLIQHGAAS